MASGAISPFAGIGAGVRVGVGVKGQFAEIETVGRLVAGGEAEAQRNRAAVDDTVRQLGGCADRQPNVPLVHQREVQRFAQGGHDGVAAHRRAGRLTGPRENHIGIGLDDGDRSGRDTEREVHERGARQKLGEKRHG